MFIQQGDVLIKSIEFIPRGSKRIEKRSVGCYSPRYILAEGEVTGHCHSIKGGDVELFENNGIMYMKNDTEVVVEHEEHYPVKIPAGLWEIGIVKEYDYFDEDVRRVKD